MKNSEKSGKAYRNLKFLATLQINFVFSIEKWLPVIIRIGPIFHDLPPIFQQNHPKIINFQPLLRIPKERSIMISISFLITYRRQDISGGCKFPMETQVFFTSCLLHIYTFLYWKYIYNNMQIIQGDSWKFHRKITHAPGIPKSLYTCISFFNITMWISSGKWKWKTE